MQEMFSYASAFNQPLEWDTKNLKNSDSMFLEAQMFNQDLTSWNATKVLCMQWPARGEYSAHAAGGDGWHVLTCTRFRSACDS